MKKTQTGGMAIDFEALRQVNGSPVPENVSKTVKHSFSEEVSQ